MTVESTPGLSEPELTALVQKVDGFCRDLSEKEQAFFAAVISRAVAGGGGDVQGYAFNDSTSKWPTSDLSDPAPQPPDPLIIQSLSLNFAVLNEHFCTGTHY